MTQVKSTPERIFFFRDGLSEGEFDRTGRAEYEDVLGEYAIMFTAALSYLRLTGAINTFCQNENAPVPLLTFIVVGKR